MKYNPFQDEPVADSSSQSYDIPVQTTSDQPTGFSTRPTRHPIALFFHFFFKAIAIGVYIFTYFIPFGFVITFIIVTIAAAFDFWTVKNVTGRLLVGLRWWNQINESDGSNKWIFESVNNKSQINPSESYLFWGGIIITPIVWGVFAIFSILKFGWLIVDIICFILSGANLIGYIKCAKDAKQKVKGMAKSYLVGTIVNQAINRV
eukprot:gene1000-1269_t